MGMLDLLKGTKPAPAARRGTGKTAAPSKAAAQSKAAAKAAAPSTGPASTQFPLSQTTQPGGSVYLVRKDLLKLVMRETLGRNGIPQHWLTADLLRTTNTRREQGMHVRFLMRHWEPRLLVHGLALEREFSQRLLVLDPLAKDWLMGFSWQFALDDDSACPALPHPGAWTAAPAEPPPVAAAAPENKFGDIIAGPVVIPKPLDDVRADLERLLALRDEDLKRHGPGGDQFAPTRPATL